MTQKVENEDKSDEIDVDDTSDGYYYDPTGEMWVESHRVSARRIIQWRQELAHLLNVPRLDRLLRGS